MLTKKLSIMALSCYDAIINAYGSHYMLVLVTVVESIKKYVLTELYELEGK